MQFDQDAAKLGAQHGGEALQPSSTAKVVSVRNGQTVATDGPFSETKEQLGGFYIHECDNLDTAVKIAALIPLAPTGHIEVRPIIDFGEMPTS